jgi:hypothetical protein
MKELTKILMPGDLSDNSCRALAYGCWLAAKDGTAVLMLHVANELNAWKYYPAKFWRGKYAPIPWPWLRRRTAPLKA